ncbi:MAG: LarC family nickel insertion protein, partial [Anaerolineae bacterium]|nr:LarC family nickel insertion protein [Anaerolineae bacterium]
IYGRDVDAELVTPTGAAILTTLVDGFGAAPPMQVEQVGYGAGSRDLPLPNLLRVSIGTTTEEVKGYEEDVVTVIETNIDDMNPQLYEHVMEQLFGVGALDVFLTPIQMKRNRPGVQLSVLVAEEHVADALDVLFAETTTIGVRTCPMRRWKLGRERVAVETRYGPVGVKVARRGRAVVNVAPEYRECRRVAEKQSVPLKEVYQAALEAARAQVGLKDENDPQG